jgi:hypothetical protein
MVKLFNNAGDKPILPSILIDTSTPAGFSIWMTH